MVGPLNPSSFHPLARPPCVGPRRGRILLVEGRVVAPVDARPSLHGAAGIDLLQLGCGFLGLLVVAGPSVGGGEVRTSGKKLLFPPATALLHHSIACSRCARWHIIGGHWGTAGSRGLSRSAVSIPPTPSSLWPRNLFQKLPSHARPHSWGCPQRGLSLRYCRSPLPFVKENRAGLENLDRSISGFSA